MEFVELEQFLHAFTSRGFNSVSWAFRLSIQYQLILELWNTRKPSQRQVSARQPCVYEDLFLPSHHCLTLVPGTVSEGLNGWSEALTVGLAV